MNSPVSIAIETTSRRGGLALGAGNQMLATCDFDAGRRHAALLIGKLDELLAAHQLSPTDIDELYVSLGPGSFTGIRVGVTVARAYAQARPGCRCVGVPTPTVVAENASYLSWDRLAHVHDAKGEHVYVTFFQRHPDRTPKPEGPSQILAESELISSLDRPVLLTGEGLGYHELTGDSIAHTDESLWLPTAASVWAVGRRMATNGEFTDYHHLLPHYTRKPEAVRLWEQREQA